MPKKNLNPHLQTIEDKSMVFYIVLLCLQYFTWVVTKIMELLLFRIWLVNLVVKTLDSGWGIITFLSILI